MEALQSQPASLRSQLCPQKPYPSPNSLPSPEICQFQEFSRIPALLLDETERSWQAREKTHSGGMSQYFHHAGSSVSGNVYGLDFRRSRSIHTESNLDLVGPLDVAGSIRARSIYFDGDFIVSDTIDAYGNIQIDGNMTAEGRIKAFGDISINGNLTASGKIKGSSRLKLRGNIYATDVEIYGNVTIRGYLYCRKLTVYGSIILIGPNSTYDVAGEELVTGLSTRREHEPDWDI